MRSGGRRFWIRGTLIAAIAGHWIANVLFDDDQYARAGLIADWTASLPAFVQTAILLGIVVAMGRSPGPATRPSHPVRLVAALVSAQLGLFFLLETSERLLQRAPFVDKGIFGSGFLLELAFAVGSALLLAAIGSAIAGIARSIRREPPSRALVDVPVALRTDRPTAADPSVPGDVRAPPLAA